MLERTVVAGVTTNRDFLVATLRTDAFLAGDTRTDFIDVVSPATVARVDDDDFAAAVLAAVMERQASNRATGAPLGFLRSGYRNSAMPPQTVRFTSGERALQVAYRSLRSGGFEAWIDDDEPRRVDLVSASTGDGSPTVVAVDGLRSSFDVVRRADNWTVHGPAGAVELVELPLFPELDGDGVVGGQVAPMPGAVRVVAVEVGSEVAAGQTLVVMEAMKMEHTIAAPAAGVVTEVRCAVGDQVDNGQVLVVLDVAEPDGT